MKKLIVICLLGLLLLLTACERKPVDHPVRTEPTEAAFQGLVDQLKKSTVALIGHYMEFELGLGSGFIFRKEETENNTFYYYVGTNAHVVDGLTHMKVKTWFNTEELGDIFAFPAGDFSPPDYEDIAIIRFESKVHYPVLDIKPLTENVSVDLSVGMTVFGIGTPIQTNNFNIVTNFGIISSLSNNFISHTSNINPGNSGGPLFSYDGTFIGINTQRIEEIRGEVIYLLSESIHVNQVAKMIERRLNEVTPKLGIHVVNFTDFIAMEYDLIFGEKGSEFDPFDYVEKTASNGVVIIDINSTRPSFGVLQNYDRIIELNGTPIATLDQLLTAIGTIKSGSVYEFTVRRKVGHLFNTIQVEIQIP